MPVMQKMQIRRWSFLVDGKDFGSDVLAGIAFQRKLEREAFCLGGRDYRAPAQSVQSFLEKSTPDLSKPLTTEFFLRWKKQISAKPFQSRSIRCLEQGMRRF